MKSMASVISMGGYASYVWSAYGIGFLLLMGNLYFNKLRRTKMRKSLERFMKRQAS